MSIRKNSDKAPKPKKEKKEKAPKAAKASKPKKSSKKKGKGADADDDPLINDGFDATSDEAPFEPVASAKTKKEKVKKQKQPLPKAPTDVYTLLLLLGFIFFIAASVFMYLDVSSYK